MKITSYYIDGKNTLHTFIEDIEHISIERVFSDLEAEELIKEIENDH